MAEKKVYPTTQNIRYLERQLLELQELLEKSIRPVLFWKKSVNIQDKIALVKEVGIARSNLWEAVYREYPETLGKSLSLEQREIKEI